MQWYWSKNGKKWLEIFIVFPGNIASVLVIGFSSLQIIEIQYILIKNALIFIIRVDAYLHTICFIFYCNPMNNFDVYLECIYLFIAISQFERLTHGAKTMTEHLDFNWTTSYKFILSFCERLKMQEIINGVK